MADIGALAIQVEALSEGAEKSIQRLTKALAKLEAATVLGAGLEDVTSHLGAIQAQIEKINTGKFGDMVKKIQKLSRTRVDGTLTQSMSNIASTSNSVNRSLGNTAVRMGVMGLSLRAVVNTVASFVKYSLDYTENMNLFMVSMGKYAEEAERYANIVSEVMGIDPSTWMRNQGVFMALAEGFGVASDRAYIMSKNLTQLGYDISSFYNLGIEEAFQKLQSGIAGELEPLRRLGIDLSEARLKAIALELGITKTYTAMTQAEKAQLRYHAIMTQTSKVQGDMARTLDAPANQLRILKASATQAARAIGNTFIPIINSLMPVAIAAANAIRIIASAFASILGFALPTVDYSGISGAANAAGQLDKNLGGAGGSAKELQKALMGFDEINKLPDASGGGGGGGGNLLGDDFNFELLEYDFLGEAVNSRVQQLMQKLSPALDFIKNNAADILQIAKAAGIAFLEWKIASKFLPDLRTGKNIVNKIKNTLLGLTIGYITIKFAFKFTQDFMENSTDGNLDWGSLISSGLTSTFGSALAGLVIKPVFGSSKAGWIATGATLTISALTDMSLQYNDVINGGGWDTDNILTGIKDMLQLAVGGALIGFSVGGASGAAFGSIAGLGVSLASTLFLVMSAGHASITKKAQKQLHLDVLNEKIKLEGFVEEQLQFTELDARFEALDAKLTLSETAKNNLTNSVIEFSNSLNLLRLGVDTEKTKLKIKDQLTAEDGILTYLNTYLENEENRLKAIIELAPPVASDGDENFASNLFESSSAFYSGLQSSVDVLGATLAELLEKSFTTKLTEKEAALANSISQMFASIENMISQKEIADEFYKAVGSINWSDLNVGSYTEAITLLGEEYNNAVAKIQRINDEAKAQMLADKNWAENYVLPNLLSAYELASFDGNTEKMTILKAEIETQMKIIKDFESQLNNWETTHSAEKFGEALLTPYIDSVKEAAFKLFPDAFKATKEETEKAISEMNTWAAKFVETSLTPLTTFGGLLSVESTMSAANKQKRERAQYIQSAVQSTYDMFGSLFSWAKGDASGGGGSPIITQAQEAGKQVADAFVGAIDEGTKQVEALGNENTFAGLRSQLSLTSEEAKGITTAINEIPSEHAITLNIPGYSTIINRINNIATRVKSIASGTVNIKVKAGVDSGSKAFLLQLASISPSSTLASQLINLVNVSAFARGGFPKNGELFIANENGPELVGRIGNKTAVANEDQIGDTILNYMEQAEGGGGSLDEERLASVLVRALKNAGVGAVRIDGRDIVRSLNRETQRTGHTPLTIK